MCLTPDAPDGLVDAAYRWWSKQLHPDLGGDDAHMVAVNSAMAVIRQDHESRPGLPLLHQPPLPLHRRAATAPLRQQAPLAADVAVIALDQDDRSRSPTSPSCLRLPTGAWKSTATS